MLQIRAGSQAYFQVEVRDVSDNKALYSPTGGVKVTLYKPDDTIAVDSALMTLESVGLFSYLHQTAVGDPVGDWTADYEAVDAAGTVLTFKQRVFHLKA